MKGISKRTNKNGEVVYRVNTCVNGQKCKGRWSSDLKEVEKELNKLTILRRKHIPTNQHTFVPNNISIKELLEKFYESEFKKMKEITFYNTKKDLDFLFKDILCCKVKEISHKNIVLTGQKNRAVQLIKALERLNKFSKKENIPFYVDISELREIANAREESGVRIYFMSMIETARLFNWFKQNPSKINNKAKRAIELALYNGLRLGEVLALRRRDVDFEKNVMTICSSKYLLINGYKNGTKGKKHGRTRVLQLNKHSRDALKEILTERDMKPEDLFFPYSHGWMCIGVIPKLKEAKIMDTVTGEIVPVLNPNYTFHTFRHTYASIFFKQHGTKDNALRDLMLTMGHTTLDMTLKYVHTYNAYTGDMVVDLSYRDATKIENARKKNLADDIQEILSGVKITDVEFRRKILEVLEKNEDKKVGHEGNDSFQV